MKCPTCKTELKRILYEGMSVFRCFGCAGYLMQDKRLDAVRRVAVTPVNLLKHEVINELRPDTVAKIKCPRCYYPMDKVKLPSPASLMLDACRDCDHIWLDGGELARIQLAYECSDIGRDRLEMRHRYESLTPEEKAELQHQINKQGEKPALSVTDLLAIALSHRYFR